MSFQHSATICYRVECQSRQTSRTPTEEMIHHYQPRRWISAAVGKGLGSTTLLTLRRQVPYRPLSVVSWNKPETCFYSRIVAFILYHQLNWNLFSEAGAFPDQVPLRCLRVRYRERSCLERQRFQADVHARQQQLQHRFRPLGICSRPTCMGWARAFLTYDVNFQKTSAATDK